MSDEQNKAEEILEEGPDAGVEQDQAATEEAGAAQDQAATEEADAAQEAPIELTNDEKVAAMEEEVAAIKDQMVREQAETQNIRKRMQSEVEKARKFALDKFAEDLLQVMDNLERAIDNAGDDEAVKPIVEGVELTRKSFVDILAKYNVEQLDPHGEPFDPQLHEAMTMVPNPDMEPNSVMDVFQKGYVLNGRLIRPARVVVSKAP